MRIVFMGTPEFAVPILRALAEVHDVATVYTRPDTSRGRGRVFSPSAVAETAESLGLRVERVASLRDAGVAAGLGDYAPDVVCVAAFGLMLPESVLEVPAGGCVNVHASLLPRWRGAAPIERAILAGDKVTGVSIMRMEAGLDTGPVALRVPVEIGEADATTLTGRLADVGARALLTVLEEVEDDSVAWIPQGEEGATYADKVTSAEVALHPGRDVGELVRRVRASSRRAPSRAVIAGREVTVLGVVRASVPIPPARVATTDGSLLLGAHGGALEVLSLTPAGRAAMAGRDYVRGARLGADAVWEAPR